jgi:hypothetical protein
MKFLTSAAVSLFLISLAGVSYSQGSRTEYDSYEYEIAEDQMTWIEASAFAKSKGGTLVKIETVEQNTWLKGFLASVNTTAQDGGGAIYSWLGGTDSMTEGTWLWEDGTQVPFNNSGTVWWGNGSGHGPGGSEPDNFGGSQHCLAIGLSDWPTGSPGFYGTSGQWNDINCSNELRFVIQYSPNVSPSVAISGGNRTIADTDGVAGESVSFTGTATDSDGTIATTEWLVGGSVVATGLTPSIALPNGSTVITFKATDNVGASSTTTATITVATPTYTVTDEWPSPYNGVTPDSSFGLAFNNIGVFSASDSIIYTCLRVFTDDLPGSVDGIGEFDIGFTIVSLDEGTVQVTKFREFNTIGALNEDVELPDCSGKFETTTGIYTDIIEVGDSVLETTWSLIDPTNLILKLSSYQELTANQ